MRRLRAFYDLCFKSSKRHKNRKKVKFMRKATKNRIFSIFVTLRTFEEKVVESLETSHFVENWLLYNSRLLKQVFCCDFWMLKNPGFGFSEILFWQKFMTVIIFSNSCWQQYSLFKLLFGFFLELKTTKKIQITSC